jgi:hypothetical protein
MSMLFSRPTEATIHKAIRFMLSNVDDLEESPLIKILQRKAEIQLKRLAKELF